MAFGWHPKWIEIDKSRKPKNRIKMAWANLWLSRYYGLLTPDARCPLRSLLIKCTVSPILHLPTPCQTLRLNSSSDGIKTTQETRIMATERKLTCPQLSAWPCCQWMGPLHSKVWRGYVQKEKLHGMFEGTWKWLPNAPIMVTKSFAGFALEASLVTWGWRNLSTNACRS